MTNGSPVEPLNVILSRDELLLVLSTLESDYIPGLDADPLGELTPDQQSLALTVAGRGLMARELAQLGEDGQLAVHMALLTAVGVCAYSQNAVFAYHWPAGSETPTRYFGHLRGDVAVAHTRPQDVLHLFTLLPSKAALIDQILELCQYRDTSGTQKGELTVSQVDFARSRELAAAGDVDQAAAVLAGGQPGPAAQSLAETLAGASRVTILQTLKQQTSGDAQKRDFTLVQNSDQAWLVMAGADDSAPLTVRTTTGEELCALLTESI